MYAIALIVVRSLSIVSERMKRKRIRDKKIGGRV